MNDERFQLNRPPPQKRPQFEDQAGSQRKLFAGLDCLPGTQNLFDTDGQPEKRDGSHSDFIEPK